MHKIVESKRNGGIKKINLFLRKYYYTIIYYNYRCIRQKMLLSINVRGIGGWINSFNYFIKNIDSSDVYFTPCPRATENQEIETKNAIYKILSKLDKDQIECKYIQYFIQISKFKIRL